AKPPFGFPKLNIAAARPKELAALKQLLAETRRSAVQLWRLRGQFNVRAPRCEQRNRFSTRIQMLLRNIHAHFKALLPQKAHGYCVLTSKSA
ncbi:MAG: hypothetical protein ACRCV9_12285, partial [Burkholderiaceae bacterium]